MHLPESCGAKYRRGGKVCRLVWEKVIMVGVRRHTRPQHAVQRVRHKPCSSKGYSIIRALDHISPSTTLTIRGTFVGSKLGCQRVRTHRLEALVRRRRHEVSALAAPVAERRPVVVFLGWGASEEGRADGPRKDERSE